jgi:hypothetical protein
VRMGGRAGVRVCMRVRYVYMCLCVHTHKYMHWYISTYPPAHIASGKVLLLPESGEVPRPLLLRESGEVPRSEVLQTAA